MMTNLFNTVIRNNVNYFSNGNFNKTLLKEWLSLMESIIIDQHTKSVRTKELLTNLQNSDIDQVALSELTELESKNSEKLEELRSNLTKYAEAFKYLDNEDGNSSRLTINILQQG